MEQPTKEVDTQHVIISINTDENIEKIFGPEIVAEPAPYSYLQYVKDFISQRILCRSNGAF